MAESDQILIGVIGGSGLYHLDNLHFVKHVNPKTPWGYPSAPITISRLTSPPNACIAFIARHGAGHTISPSKIPSRANIAALKSLGVKAILAFSAVGSLREEIAPGCFSIPSQIIDRTKGIRPTSFFEETSIVAHAAFGDPFSIKLCKWLEETVKHALDEEGRDVKLFSDKCIVCMEGPQFSTRAESNMYRAWGGDLIGMTVLPEAKLAKEAELSYALIAMATDYDSWKVEEEPVTASHVFKTLSANADTARFLAKTILPKLHEAVVASEAHGAEESLDILSGERGSMRFSIMPRSGHQKEDDKEKLRYILQDYF